MLPIYHPSLDRPRNLRAYRFYLPLSRMYAFAAIPAALETQCMPPMPGAQGCDWTPDIGSMGDVEEVTFLRLSTFAEAVWSIGSSRNWSDFSCRLNVEYRRLAICGIDDWEDDAVEIGQWKHAQIIGQDNLPGVARNARNGCRREISFEPELQPRQNGLKSEWVALLEKSHGIVRDAQIGFTGMSSRAVKAHDWNYFFNLPVFENGAHDAVQTSVTSEGGNDSSGVVFLGTEPPQ